MPDVRRETHRGGRELSADRLTAQLAAEQWGVVARRQLTAAGVTERTIEGRVAAGRLLRLHRGVYAVGHRRLRREGYWLAAVLAVGPEAVLSHRDAAALHGIRFSNAPRIDVSTTGRSTGSRGIRVHHARVLDADDVARIQGIPVTSLARTLVDLAGVVPQDQLARALSEAERINLLDVRALHAARARTRGRRGPGHARLTTAAAELEAHGTTLTRSALEAAFLNLTSAAGLPRPQTNVHIRGREVDAYWPTHNLVVELDGWEFHRSRQAFQHDREKDAELTAHGYRVVRFTHDDVMRRPATAAERLRGLLAAPGVTAPGV